MRISDWSSDVCSSDLIDALFQRLYLIPHRHATNEQRHAKFIILAVFLKIFGDLSREFAGGLQNKRPGHTRAAAAMRQNIDHRQDEAGSFSGACLSNANQVLHHQHRRDRLRLIRGRLVIRSEELSSELQSYMRISSSDFVCT